jgi:DNA-binding response OmpR family regulator
MSGNRGGARVLVVDDEPEMAEMLALQLERHYDVESVGGGESALAALDEAFDVVLLDRRMPGLSGDDVLEAIRDRGVDCRVIMLSAVTPDYEVMEMPFDDYLRKPVGGDALVAAVERQLEDVGEQRRTCRRLLVKRELLAETKPAHELERHEGYQALLDQLSTLRDRLDVGDVDGEVPR